VSAVGRVDAFQRKHAVLGFPLAVIYKFVDDQGSYLSALITYYAFVSLFPLLLLLATVLGLVLIGHPDVQRTLIDSAMKQIPVVGDELGDPRSLSGGIVGVLVGVLGSIYGGLGVAQALQNAMNVIWLVPRNSRPNPIKARGRSVLLLLAIGLTILASTSLSTYGGSFATAHAPWLTWPVRVLAVLVNAAGFLFTFRFGSARGLGLLQVLPGALAAAVLWQLLQSAGVVYVQHVVSGSTDTNGVFAVVLGLIAFLYVTAIMTVLSAELNVVRVLHLWPRALLTPFTDNVELTGGDRNAYIGQARAQRHKGFETVTVTFDENRPDPDAP